MNMPLTAQLKLREQDKEATVYIGNLDERVTDSLVWELMLQAGRIVNVHLPKDRVTQTHQGYGFVEFISEEDADYAAKIMNQIRLYNKPIRVNKASADKQKSVEIGAELFVGNLDPMVDERTLYDTFSRFGPLIAPPKVCSLKAPRASSVAQRMYKRASRIRHSLNDTQVARDDANLSKGYAFLSFATFDASDDAIQNMHGQFLSNKEISVQYAYKKDGKGERHGDEAERRLAAQAQKHGVQLPVQPVMPGMFGAPPGGPPPSGMVNGFGAPGGLDPRHGANGTPLGHSPFAAPPSAPPGPPAGMHSHSPAPPPGLPHHPGYPPPPQQQRPPPQNSPLPPPPSGLPARPPPSQAGYGGPAGFMPQGFGGPQQGQPPQGAPPGFGPPPGFPAPPPAGFPGQPGAPPPGMPPGFVRR